LGSSRATLPTGKTQKIQTKKCTIAIIWLTFGIQSFLALPADMRYDAEFFYTSVLPDIERNLCDSKRMKAVRGIYLHLDNAPGHKAQRSRQGIARTKGTRIVHTAYSHDAAPSGSFLFGYLKGEMAGFIVNSAAGIPSEIHQIFQEISKETLVAVSGERGTRLESII
jgi:hypothetical protein